MDDVELRPPTVADGPALADLAEAAGGLDVNSRYAYVLWCRDFAATSVVARRGGSGDGTPSDGPSDTMAGFVTGYRRPDDPSTLFVWQVAVHPAHRGRGVAGSMLDDLARRWAGTVDHVEATVTPSNAASERTFDAFATRWGAEVVRRELFGEVLLGADHEPEQLLRIGPLRALG